MRTRTLNYIKLIDNDIKSYETDESFTKNDLDKAINRHLVQIGFFQHERFIHLIVTFLFALITISCVLFTVVKFDVAILVLTLLSFVLLVPYIRHYYLLENSVQQMYKQYDKMLSIRDKL